MHIIKRILVIIAALNVTGLSAQTYYYERTAKIEPGGHRVTDSGDGHFITFTPYGCYDSDNRGMTAQTGFRQYKKSRDGIDQYYGKSYFGQAYYSFSADRSRLNVDVERSGIIYVYERRTAPTQKTSSMRGYSDVLTPSGTYVPFAPIWIPPVVTGATTTVGSSTTSTSYERTCRGCHGTGQCTSCNGTGYFVANTGYYVGDSSKTLHECGACHATGRCQVCYGRGTIR